MPNGAHGLADKAVGIRYRGADVGDALFGADNILWASSGDGEIRKCLMALGAREAVGATGESGLGGTL